MIDRAGVLAKLNDYLEEKISKTEVYEWALMLALSKEYEDIAVQDPLIQKTVLAMIDINHADIKKIPPRKSLEYLKHCLEGSEEFLEVTLPAQAASEETQNPKYQFLKKAFRPRDVPKGVLVILRIYVIVFCLCSIAIHSVSILNPGFLRLGESTPSSAAIVRESFPHLIYAFFLLIPPVWIARGIWFYLSFPILTFGMLYYWYISFSFAMKFALSAIFILVVLPFSAIPATLALVLLFIYREKSKGMRENNQFF